MSVEAGMSLQYDQDNVRGPAYKPQHHAATQEEPVIGVVVNQALESMGYQGIAQRDLTRDRWGEVKEKCFSKSKYVMEKVERRFIF